MSNPFRTRISPVDEAHITTTETTEAYNAIENGSDRSESLTQSPSEERPAPPGFRESSYRRTTDDLYDNAFDDTSADHLRTLQVKQSYMEVDLEQSLVPFVKEWNKNFRPSALVTICARIIDNVAIGIEQAVPTSATPFRTPTLYGLRHFGDEQMDLRRRMEERNRDRAARILDLEAEIEANKLAIDENCMEVVREAALRASSVPTALKVQTGACRARPQSAPAGSLPFSTTTSFPGTSDQESSNLSFCMYSFCTDASPFISS